MAGGLGLFWGLACLIYAWLKPDNPRGGAGVRGALSACEWLRGHVLTGFPWDLPGETWRAGSAPSQVAALVGAYGLTWITLAIAAPGPVRRLRASDREPGARGWPPWPWPASTVSDTAQARDARPRSARAHAIRIVQADVSRRTILDDGTFSGIVDRYCASPHSRPLASPDIVIWPEGPYRMPGTTSWRRSLGSRGHRRRAQARASPAARGLPLSDLPKRRPVTFNSLAVLSRRATAGDEDLLRQVSAGALRRVSCRWTSLMGALGHQEVGACGRRLHAGTSSPGADPGSRRSRPPAADLLRGLFPGFTREGEATV